MRKRIRNGGKETVGDEKSQRRLENLLWVLSAVILGMAVLILYRYFLTRPGFPVVLSADMVIFTLFLLTYVIYNRGFSRRNLTPEMLPDEWSAEEKEAFLESGRERMRKSKWMLVPICAFGFTFAYDMIELYVLPYLRAMFS